MCFSAEVSFAAAAVLGVTGCATLKANNRKELGWLAAIPLLFALQQFCEGTLWLHMPLSPNSPWIAKAAQYVYMIFAYFFWPVYVPFALMMAEKERKRKYIIGAALLAGLMMISYFAYNYLLNYEGNVTVTVIGKSLHYSADDPMWRLIYSAIVVIPCFTSSLKWIKLFGVLVIASILVSEFYFSAVFVSVWCFFAALISFVLYGILRANRS